MNSINNKSKSFMIYKEWEETILALDNDEERGALLRALFLFVRTGEMTEFKGGLKIAFIQITNQLRRDAAKYEKKCERNRANANIRWGRTDANACDTMRHDAKNADKEKDEDKDKEKDKDKDEGEDKDKEKDKDKGEGKDKDKDKVTDTKPSAAQESVVPPAPSQEKHLFGEFGNISLSHEEHDMLVKKFGSELTDKCIERMDSYMEQTGKCYRNCYAKLKNWISEEYDKNSTKPRNDRQQKEDTYFTEDVLSDYENYVMNQASYDFAKILAAGKT